MLQGYSRQYNCHGYAWHVSTGGSQIAIDQPTYGGVTPYVSGSNPSYTQTSYSGSQAKLRVRYSGDHSAVTTAYSNLFISKWGPGPLVRHAPNDVSPGSGGYGTPSTYWTCDYTPPLTSVYLDSSPVSGSFLPLSYVSHNMYIYYGLDPDTGPIFGSTASSTTITSQSGSSVNFNFSGPSNNGGLSIQFCGTYRHSFMFYKPSGARLGVFPNPAREEATIVISNQGLDFQNDIVTINTEDGMNKMVRLHLMDGNNKMVGDYSTSIEGSRSTVRLDRGLKGVYYLKATFADGTVESKRILIEE